LLKVEAFKLATIFVTNSVVVKAEAKAKALNPFEAKAKTKDTNLCPRGFSRPRPVLEDHCYLTRQLTIKQIDVI